MNATQPEGPCLCFSSVPVLPLPFCGPLESRNTQGGAGHMLASSCPGAFPVPLLSAWLVLPRFSSGYYGVHYVAQDGLHQRLPHPHYRSLCTVRGCLGGTAPMAASQRLLLLGPRRLQRDGRPNKRSQMSLLMDPLRRRSRRPARDDRSGFGGGLGRFQIGIGFTVVVCSSYAGSRL